MNSETKKELNWRIKRRWMRIFRMNRGLLVEFSIAWGIYGGYSVGYFYGFAGFFMTFQSRKCNFAFPYGHEMWRGRLQTPDVVPAIRPLKGILNFLWPECGQHWSKQTPHYGSVLLIDLPHLARPSVRSEFN